MTLPEPNPNANSSKYHVQIGQAQGPVIGDNAQVVQQFYITPTKSQVDLSAAEAIYRQQVVNNYKWLNFSGFDTPDLSLANVPLEEVFVRLSLTVKKFIREPVPSEKANQAEQREHQQRERVITVQEPIELDQALDHHLLIVGEPGAGKSTLLRWLAVTFAQGRQREHDHLGPSADADRLPVLVELRRLPNRYAKSEDGEVPSWFQLLPKYLTDQDAFTHTPPQLLTQALDDGRCLLLVDGLDEVADRQVRARIVRSLSELVSHFPGNRVIIGSRPAGVSEGESTLHPLQFHRCQIERFTPEDVQRFFRFWYALDRNLTPEQQHNDADALYARVQASPETLRLASTPLLSTILVLIWRNEGNLPEHRVDLYERCCRMLIKHWEAHRQVASQDMLVDMHWEDHLNLLTPLAYTIHSQEQRASATREELVPLLARALQTAGYANEQAAATLQAKHFLDALGLRSGLLQYIGDDKYGFPHLTFQEYLAARHISAQPEPDYIDLVMAHLHEAWWQQVHLLTIAHLASRSVGASRASTLILTILHVYRPPRWILDSSRKPGLHLIGLGKRIPQGQLERRIAWILAREFELAARAYLECPLHGTTAKVGTILSAQATSLVRDILYDESRCEVQNALLTVAFHLSQRQGNGAVVRILLGAALPARNWGVREQAAKILGQVGAGNEVVVSALLAALHDPEGMVREQAAKILGQVGVGNEAVMRALLEALRDPHYGRYEAAKSLGQIEIGVGNEAVTSALLAALHDPEELVRMYTAGSLGQVGVGNEAVANALLEVALHDPDKLVQKMAVESLGKVGIGNEAVVRAILTALHDPVNPVKEQAAESLRQLGVGNEAVVSALLAILHDPDGKIREQAAEWLGQMGVGNEAVVSALLEVALHDPYWPAQCDALRSLKQVGMGNEAVVSTLLKVALHDPNNYVRSSAVMSLRQMGMSNEAVASTLLEVALHDPDWSVRCNALWSLKQEGLGNEAVASGLLAALHDANKLVREGAVECLGEVGVSNEAVVSALLETLHDPDGDMRKQAAESLGKLGLGNEAVANALLAILHDPDRHVRAQAAESLKRMGIGNEAVVSTLLEALHYPGGAYDADWPVRVRAVRSLGEIGVGNEAVVSVLLKALGYSHASVQEQASLSLGEIRVGNDAVVSALLEALHHKFFWFVREKAAKMLGKVGVGNDAAVSALLAALHDNDSNVQKQAAESLGQMGIVNEAVVSALLAALHNTYLDMKVREQVAASLARLEIKDTIQLRQVLLAFDQYLYYDKDTKMRRVALVSIRQLLDGRPIPGYRWVPLRKR